MVACLVTGLFPTNTKRCKWAKFLGVSWWEEGRCKQQSWLHNALHPPSDGSPYRWEPPSGMVSPASPQACTNHNVSEFNPENILCKETSIDWVIFPLQAVHNICQKNIHCSSLFDGCVPLLFFKDILLYLCCRYHCRCVLWFVVLCFLCVLHIWSTNHSNSNRTWCLRGHVFLKFCGRCPFGILNWLWCCPQLMFVSLLNTNTEGLYSFQDFIATSEILVTCRCRCHSVSIFWPLVDEKEEHQWHHNSFSEGLWWEVVTTY